MWRTSDEKRVRVTRSHSTVEPTGHEKWGSLFIKKSHLKELLLRSNDCFTIRCVLTIIKRQTKMAIEVPQSNLHQDLANMLKDGEGTDVTFSVGDQLFHAHRYVLAARSVVFRAELFGETKEKATQHIKIHDTEPTVFGWLLYFMYTDSLPDDCNDNADRIVAMQHLLVAADRYGLDRLRLMREEKLCSWLDVQSVAATLALAEQHQCVQLRDVCLRFIDCRDVLGAVMETEGFKHLSASCHNPSCTKEILDDHISQN